jgi:uncharacterized membrane protein YdjX (TVP38/TMEM64 family)
MSILIQIALTEIAVCIIMFATVVLLYNMLKLNEPDTWTAHDWYNKSKFVKSLIFLLGLLICCFPISVLMIAIGFIWGLN